MTSHPDDQAANASWLIETKLSLPVSNTDLIDRPMAMRALSRISTHKIGFVVAPAGYGKTSLLSQWAHSTGIDSSLVAWVSLNKSDGELRQFASYCIAAIARAGVDLGQLELAAEQFLVETAIISIVPRLVAEISRIEKDVILILDDYHLAESAEISDFLKTLISYAPGNLRFLISSRTVPDLGLSSLIASRQAFEIGVDTLRFSLDEIRLFAGDVFDEPTLNYLEAKTEGWAVAVQLAKLAPADQRAHGALPPQQREHIANYLIQQILKNCSENERSFLLKTSILDQFTPRLAAKICGRSVSSDIFQNSTLVRPLLVRLDSEEQWYRYHHLFSELLHDILTNDFPELLPDLHVDASVWFEENGDVANAVYHAKKAGDVGRAAQLVLDAGGWELALFGGISLLRTLVGNFSIDELQHFPRLRFAYALSLMKDGDTRESASQLSIVELGKNYEKLTDSEKRDYIAVKAHLDIYQDSILSDASQKSLGEALDCWPSHDARGAGVLQAVVAISANARWQFDAAIDAANGGVNSMRRANSVLGIGYSYMHLGQTAFYRGDMELSNAHLEEAAAMAEENFGADSRLKNNSDIILQSIKYWRDPATLDSKLLFSLLQISCDTDSWFDIYYTGFSCLLDHGFAIGDAGFSHDLLELCKLTCRRREIARLSLLLPFFELSAATARGDEKPMLLAAKKCEEFLDRMEESFALRANCIPLAEAILILGNSHKVYRFTEANLGMLNRVIDYSAERSANFFLIRLLVLRARLTADRRGIQAGIADILAAARHAARTSIRTPFTAFDIVALVRAAIRFGRDKPENRLEVAFLGDCLERAVSKRCDKSKTDGKILSARELDVLTELAVGQSNKGIARALDMTDHTVKFHLKNIFIKLDVDNRISAINTGRRLDLIQ